MPTIRRTSPPRSISGKAVWYGMAGLVFLLIVVVAWNARQAKPAPGEVTDVVARVRELAYVGSDTPPSIATINDADRLRTQNPAYYRDAENGDKLLIWNDVIVLYSVSRDRILAIQPTIAPAPTEAVPATATTTASATSTSAVAEDPLIEVRNGTGKSGKAREVSTQLEGEGYRVTTPTNAAKTYPTSVILVAAGKSFPESVAKIQELTGAKIGTAEGELASSADIILILGTDAL